MQFAIALALLLAISPRARIEARASVAIADRASRSLPPILAMWLSLGPLPNAGERASRASASTACSTTTCRLQRRPRARALRDDRRTVPRGARRLRQLRVDSRASAGVQLALVAVLLAALILIEGAAHSDGDQPHLDQNEADAAGARLDPRRRAPRRSTRVSPRCRPARRSPSSRSATPRGRSATSITRRRTGSRSPTATAAASRRATRSASRGCSASTRIPRPRGASLKESGTTHVVVHRNAFAKPPMLIRLRIG